MDVCSAPPMTKGKSRSGNLVDKPQSTATLWRNLVLQLMLSCLDLQKATARALTSVREKAQLGPCIRR